MGKVKNIQRIYRTRTDISKYLLHWTTRTNFFKILREGFLISTFAQRDVSDEGGRNTIRGEIGAVCFSDIPVGNYLQANVADSKRYPLWGFAIPRANLYAYGARPLLYSDESFYDQLKGLQPKTVGNKYRFLFSNYKPLGEEEAISDWLHEREWRACPNIELNNKIGLVGAIQRDQELLKAEWLVPIHLPQSDIGGSLQWQLPEKPEFILLVETEENKRVIEICKRLDQSDTGADFPIYREKYLAVLQMARIFSFEYIQDMRNCSGLWRIEDVIDYESKAQSKIGILWDRARIKSRRQVLQCVGEERNYRYEYKQWQDFPVCNSIFTECIQKRIENNPEACSILEEDLKDWLRKIQYEGG